MHKGRLEAFSDGVIAIPLAFVQRWVAGMLYITVALIWLIPDRRIEEKLHHQEPTDG